MPLSRSLAALAGSAAVVVTTLGAGPADAAPDHGERLARHLVGPLSLAVDGRDVYVTQNFTGVLNKLRPGRSPKTLYAAKGGNEVGGVSVRHGTVVFTETASDAQGNPSDSWIKRLTRSGKVKTLAHIRSYENAHNPDGKITYGLRGISDTCAAQWPTDQFGPPVYTGIKDSHPYATFQTKRKIYVADAGMNAVLAVSRSGKIRTVAVTPPAPVKVTADLASSFGLPDCVVGKTYYGESVPTDVARGPRGKLYVSTEGGGLGEQMPLGVVYRVDPASGKTTKVAGRLSAPTGLAVTPKGDVYVAELFAGRISRIRHGSHQAHTFVKVGLPGAVELGKGGRGAIYATTNVLPPEKGAPDGRVMRYHR